MVELTNLAINFSNITSSNVNICELNQIAMLNQLEKMPVNIVILLGLSLLSLLGLIFVVPRLKDELKLIVNQALLMFATGTLLFGTLFQIAITFSINESTWKYSSYFLSVICFIVILSYAFFKRKKIKEFINNFGG